MSDKTEEPVEFTDNEKHQGNSREHLLVAVSHSPNSIHLLNRTRQMVEKINASWTASYVETGIPLRDDERERLHQNLELARRLGAEVVLLPAEDIAAEVIHYARMKNITQIIIGKSIHNSRIYRPQKRSITQRIIDESGTIDVLVVQEKPSSYPGGWIHRFRFLNFTTLPHLLSLTVVLAVTGINLIALPLIGYRSVSTIYLLTITALAFFLGKAVVWIAPAASALLWNYLFIPPRMTFTIGELEDVLMFGMYFVAASTTGYLTSRLKANERVLVMREEKMTLLYNFSQSLSEKQTIKGIVDTSLDYVSRYFHAWTVLFLRQESGILDRYPITIRGTDLDDREYDCASYCFEQNKPCGRYTNNVPDVQYHYVPLRGPGNTMGVLGIRLEDQRTWTTDQEELLLTLGRNLALSLEREMLAQEYRRNMMTAESERLSKVLLNTVSHELRTPLTTIKGSITALMDSSTADDLTTRTELLRETLIASDRLNSIVGNLLSMSRLESGVLRLKKTWSDVNDLVSVALDHLRGELNDHPVRIEVPEDQPAVLVDFVLIVQVITNLLQNAASYTPAGSPISIETATEERKFKLVVCDSGKGVSESELPHLFDKFYRGSNEATGGVGLGLSICRGIVEAHGGSIDAHNGREKGLCVSIIIPDCVDEESGNEDKL